MKTVTVEPVRANTLIKGWRLICPSGAIIVSTTRAEATRLANLINEELAFASQQQ